MRDKTLWKRAMLREQVKQRNLTKINLTTKWYTGRSGDSYAGWEMVSLAATQLWNIRRNVPHKWVASVSLAGTISLHGHKRRTKKAAQRDAESLALKLMLGIRDSLPEILKRHGIDLKPEVQD